ncbi:MAG: glycoside hydrolase family 95 protein [Corallococcus sp.]|nr:glycoside hydrolase family 95 protein [Corallococcus sp.]
MAKNSNDLLKFCTPPAWWGEKWREGLFSGNGKTGANVYGGAIEERILLNDSSLFWQGRTTVLPDVSDKIDIVKKRIENGDFVGAQSVIPKALSAKNFRPQAEYTLPMGRLCIQFDVDGAVSDFSRTLNMANGEISVSCIAGDTKYKRELFVSRDNGLVIYRITKQGIGLINVSMNFDLMHRVNSHTPEGECNVPTGVEHQVDKQFLCFAARNDDNGSDFGAVARISNIGGVIKQTPNGVKVAGADSVLVLISTFCDANHEREWAKIKTKLVPIKDNYEKMLKAHAVLHSKLYDSVTMRLSSENHCVEDLLLEANTGNLSAELLEKLYKYGRYLFISATRDDGRMFMPTGLWNGCYKPYRSFKYNSGEVEMSYLHAFKGNLFGDMEQTFSQYESHMGDFRNNALRLFNCRGIVVPAVTAPKTGRLGSTDIFAIYFTGCAGWIANMYFKYARQSQNNKFIRQRLLPFMKEVAIFYADFFTEGKDGKFIASPSVLPMRVADSYKLGDRPVVAQNSALDFAIARDFFRNFMCALVICEEPDAVEKWREFAKKIPSQQMSGDGVYREFVDSAISVDYTGVSNGTLYPAYFSDEVNFLSDAQTIRNYANSADRKLASASMQNSFNMTVLSCVYARLGDAYKARLCLDNAVRGCSMSNLSFVDKDWRGMGVCGNGVWTPVQLQSNLAAVNAVQEMLLYSCGSVIKVLPCLPRDFKDLEFDGLLTENGVFVKCVLDSSKNSLTVELISKKESYVDLYLPRGVKKLVKCTDKLLKLTNNGPHILVKNARVDANRPLVFNFKFVAK